jgi:hypothetical protein
MARWWTRVVRLRKVIDGIVLCVTTVDLRRYEVGSVPFLDGGAVHRKARVILARGEGLGVLKRICYATLVGSWLPSNRIYFDNCSNVNTIHNRELITAHPSSPLREIRVSNNVLGSIIITEYGQEA